jgi:excisionase family DNA binding protein
VFLEVAERPRLLGIGTNRPIWKHRVRKVASLMAQDELVSPAEVARLFRVNPKTVTRWARAGKINAIRTLGGHCRYYRSEIERAIAIVRADDRDGLDNGDQVPL